MFTYFFTFMLALFLCLYIIPIVKQAALQYDIVDKPDGNLKNHASPVPYLGGLAVYVSFLLTLGLTFHFSNEVLGLLLSGTIVILLGIIDDLKALSPQLKLAGQAIAILVLMKSGIYIQLIFLPLPVCLILTFFWLMTIINAFNIIDIMDGLSTGTALIGALTLFGVALINDRPMIAVLTIAMAGALLGFLRHNFATATMYLGDSGSMFIGLMLGALAMIGSYTEHNTFGCLAPLIILGIPLFDTLFVMYIRWRRGKPVIYGSPDHFALRLRKWNLSTKQTVIASYTVSAVLGGLGIVMMLCPSNETAGAIVLCIIAAGLVAGYFLKKIDMTM